MKSKIGISVVLTFICLLSCSKGLLANVISNETLFSNEYSEMKLPNNYYLVREQLVYYKDDDMRVYYGGPVDNKGYGTKWIMPVAFTDSENKTRVVYELAFIDCDLSSAKNAKLTLYDGSDINIKLHNISDKDYNTFLSILSESVYGRHIIIRKPDVSIATFPDIYIADDYKVNKEDIERIALFLHRKFGAKRKIIDMRQSSEISAITHFDDNITIYNDEILNVDVNGIKAKLYVKKVSLKHDVWKLYYLISLRKIDENTLKERVLVRIDSGCVSGQIYQDSACDCLDQLHYALEKMIKAPQDDSVVIHIPAHDGRGFGMACKAETEIYKRGGKGMIHFTNSLDTITAAKLLYKVNDESYDIRTYDGVAEILKYFGYAKITLLTDNKLKFDAMQKRGIDVVRQATETHKEECAQHLYAKKSSSAYFPD